MNINGEEILSSEEDTSIEDEDDHIKSLRGGIKNMSVKEDDEESDIAEDNAYTCWVDEDDSDTDNETDVETEEQGFPLTDKTCRYNLHSVTNPLILSKFEKDKNLKSKEDILESLTNLPHTTTDTDNLSLKQLKQSNPESSYKNCWEVKSLSREKVMKRIEEIYRKLHQQSMEKEKIYILQPKPEEYIYVKELECIMMNGIRKSKCYELRGGELNTRFEKFHTLLNLIYNLRKTNMHVNKRWIHYAYTKLFKNEAVVDEMLDSVCLVIGCTRCNLSILSSSKGKIIGNVSFRYGKDGAFTCAKEKVHEILCEDVDFVEFEHTVEEPKFVIVVEKETIFQRLVESKFHQDYQCIIMTGCGQPSFATRIYLKRMAKTLNILVLVLTDGNPHGFEIFLTYLYGSMNMAYDSRNLRTPGIKWLGVTPKDLIDFEDDGIRLFDGDDELDTNQFELENLKGKDRKKKDELLEKDVVKKNLKWKRVLEEMEYRGEIETLLFYHLDWLPKSYLRKKLQDQDWIG